MPKMKVMQKPVVILAISGPYLSCQNLAEVPRGGCS